MNDMDKLKKLQMVAKVLREHHGYKGNKESNHSSRFDFKFDKSESIDSPCITSTSIIFSKELNN